MVRGTAAPNCTGVTAEGPPPCNLDPIYLWNPPSHPVATIPLEPAAFIGVPIRISKEAVVVIIGATCSLLGGSPAILAPHREWLTGFDPEQIAFGIGALWREPAKMEGSDKPFGGEFADTVVEILSFKDTEHQHLSGCEIGLELCSKGSRFRLQYIRVRAQTDPVAFLEGSQWAAVRGQM
jgi:hypothetical protein